VVINKQKIYFNLFRVFSDHFKYTTLS
jgi:hypothetical protein